MCFRMFVIAAVRDRVSANTDGTARSCEASEGRIVGAWRYVSIGKQSNRALAPAHHLDQLPVEGTARLTNQSIGMRVSAAVSRVGHGGSKAQKVNGTALTQERQAESAPQRARIDILVNLCFWFPFISLWHFCYL